MQGESRQDILIFIAEFLKSREERINPLAKCLLWKMTLLQKGKMAGESNDTNIKSCGEKCSVLQEPAVRMQVLHKAQHSSHLCGRSLMSEWPRINKYLENTQIRKQKQQTSKIILEKTCCIEKESLTETNKKTLILISSEQYGRKKYYITNCVRIGSYSKIFQKNISKIFLGYYNWLKKNQIMENRDGTCEKR